MSDQLMDATSVQQWLDLMQHLLVPVLWFLSWVCMLLAQGCTWLVHIILTFADDVWLPHVLEDVIGRGYAIALTLALGVAIVTVFATGAGLKVRWVRAGALLRWSVVLFVIMQALLPLYQGLERLVGGLPPALVDALDTPVLSVEGLGVALDGQVYQPFAAATGVQRGSPLAPLQPRGAAGQATALDLTLAIWHATPTEVLGDAPHLSVPTATGTLAIDTMPAGFQAAFFPDTVAATMTSPDGWTQRRAVLARGRSGTLQAGVGLLAAMVTLLPALMQVVLLLVSLLTLSAFCILAPLGLFGNASLWVGLLFKQWVGLLLWRVVLHCVVLLLDRWLLGTADLAGIALQWPLTPLILVGMLIIEWKLLKVAGRIALQATRPLRQVAATVSGEAASSMAISAEAIREQRQADGLDAVTPTTVAERGWQATTTPLGVQGGTVLGSAGGGLSLYTLIDHDMQAARQAQVQAARQPRFALLDEDAPVGQPLTAPGGVPVGTSPGAARTTHPRPATRPTPVRDEQPRPIARPGTPDQAADPSLWERMQALPGQAATWVGTQARRIDAHATVLDPALTRWADTTDAQLEHAAQQGSHDIHVTLGGDAYAVPTVAALRTDRTADTVGPAAVSTPAVPELPRSSAAGPREASAAGQPALLPLPNAVVPSMPDPALPSYSDPAMPERPSTATAAAPSDRTTLLPADESGGASGDEPVPADESVDARGDDPMSVEGTGDASGTRPMSADGTGDASGASVLPSAPDAVASDRESGAAALDSAGAASQPGGYAQPAHEQIAADPAGAPALPHPDGTHGLSSRALRPAAVPPSPPLPHAAPALDTLRPVPHATDAGPPPQPAESLTPSVIPPKESV